MGICPPPHFLEGRLVNPLVNQILILILPPARGCWWKTGGGGLPRHLVRTLQDDRPTLGGDGQDHGRRGLPQGRC